MSGDKKPILTPDSVQTLSDNEKIVHDFVEVKHEVLEEQVKPTPADVVSNSETAPVAAAEPKCGCSVEELLHEPYTTRQLSKTLEIIRKGRPTPNISVTSHSGGTKTKRMFKDHYYEKVDWLTGCDSISKLFCWPCLLFDRSPGLWNKVGFNDIFNFHKSFKRHENTQNHIVAAMQLVAFVMNHCEGRVREDAEDRNTIVRANRESLKRVIEAVGACGEIGATGIEPPLLLRLARREASPLFLVPSLHVAALNAITHAFTETLTDTIMESPFVSVFLDETPDRRVAVVIRYTTSKGELRDTFAGLMEGNDLGVIVSRLHSEYYLTGKIVAILLGALSRPETLPKDIKFVLLHSPAHRISAVIPRALRHLEECAAFFHIIYSFEQWSSEPQVEEELKARIPNCNLTKWKEWSVTSLDEHRETVRDIVHNQLDKPTAWNSSAYTLASVLQQALKDLEFTFLLKVFKELLPLTDALLEMIINNSPDLKKCYETIEDYVKVLNWKKVKFDEIWEAVQEADLEGPSAKKPRHVGTSRLVTYYRSLYETIIDAVVRQVETRFGSLRYLEFTGLLDMKDCKENNVSEKLLIQLRSKRDDFETSRLKNELLVAYAQIDFKGLQCEQLLRHLYDTGLSGPLRQVTRLARYVLVLPYASRTSNEQCLRLFSKIHSFSKRAARESALLPWASVSVENRLLNKYIVTDKFLDKAVENFASRHSFIDLTPFKVKTL